MKTTEIYLRLMGLFFTMATCLGLAIICAILGQVLLSVILTLGAVYTSSEMGRLSSSLTLDTWQMRLQNHYGIDPQNQVSGPWVLASSRSGAKQLAHNLFRLGDR